MRMSSHNTLLTVIGISAVMFVLGMALGSVAFPLARIETTTSTQTLVQNQTTTQFETTTATRLVNFTTTSYITSLPTGGGILTLTEYVTDYEQQTNTVILYVQSSTTYVCFVGTASLGVTMGPISIASENATGVFSSLTVTTMYSTVDNGITTTTITGSYPLVTYTTTISNSTVVTTECLPSV
jgi:hypothetical protein